jgi:hypothetical protein
MPQRPIPAVHPYEALVRFANERPITQENWRAVLDRLGSWRFPRSSISRGVSALDEAHMYKEAEAILPYQRQAGYRFGQVPEVVQGRPIHGPEPLRELQHELAHDLTRLTDPQRDLLPLSRGLPEALKAQPPKTVGWLLEKINALTGTGAISPVSGAEGTPPSTPLGPGGIPVVLAPRGRLPGVLPTDPVVFVPVLGDLRLWLYFALANLWVDGFLPRIGRCKTCGNFFLAKTQKKTIFCSQPCGKNATAALRGQRYRQRQQTWEGARRSLEVACEQGKRGKALTAVLKKARDAFAQAFPQKTGPRYEEARQFLARVTAQIQA